MEKEQKDSSVNIRRKKLVEGKHAPLRMLGFTAKLRFSRFAFYMHLVLVFSPSLCLPLFDIVQRLHFFMYGTAGIASKMRKLKFDF